MDKITITIEEYETLKEKAKKWDDHTAKLTKNLPNGKMTAEQRSEAARKAVQARWNRQH